MAFPRIPRFIHTLLPLCFPVLVFAQGGGDTLREVEVKEKQLPSRDSRINAFSPGQKIQSFDSAALAPYQAQNVGNFLSQQSPVFVKSYGFNGLATLNFRGSSAAQSQVYWNGVPIQNAALGFTDVSLLPIGAIHKMHLVYGGSASLWGSGNVGGAILLESAPPVFVKSGSYELSLAGGSFGQWQSGGKLGLHTKRWSFHSNLLLQGARNDFPYKDNAGYARTNEHSSLRGLALTSQLALKASEKDVLSLALWYQDYFREIPPALFESGSAKSRTDGSLRLLLDWKRRQDRRDVYIKTSFIREEGFYDDSTIALHSHNTSYQYFVEAGWMRWLGRRHLLSVFAPVQLLWMPLAGETVHQDRYALVAAYTYRSLNSRLNLSLSARSELIDNNSVLLPGLNGSFRVFPNWTLKLNIQNTYRAPSLNELYYVPGGNADLRSEKGWAEDLGYRFEGTIAPRLFLTHELTGFNRVIDDWIIWFGGSVWTPHNIATVQSRGLESDNELTYMFPRLKVRLGLAGSYTLATTLASYLPGDGSVGRQIPYTPRASARINLGLNFENWDLNYNHTFTGLRYVTTDESESVPGYDLGNLQAGYRWKKGRLHIYCFLNANNLYNTSYQVVGQRPMPGFNWMVGVRLQYI